MGEEPMSTAKASVDREASADGSITVLLVENDAVQTAAIGEMVLAAGDGQFRVETVRQPDEALDRLAAISVDIVLVGSGLPDWESVDGFARIREAVPDALVLPLDRPGSEPGTGKRLEAASWLPDVLRHVSWHKKAETVLRAAEESLFEEKERARVTLSSIGDAVLVTDTQGNVTYLNPVAEILTGWSCAEAVGRPLSDVFNIIDGGTRQPAVDPARRATLEDRTVGLEANCVLLRRDGSEAGIEDSAAPVHDRHGQVSGAVIVFRDVSQSRTMTQKMAYLAQHDALTGLVNRAVLNERLGQTISLARRYGTQAAVLFVDLNDFKRINDELGHAVGDHVLQRVAGFLQECVRTSDTVCRRGGDEFVIILTKIKQSEDAFRVVDKLFTRLPNPLMVDGYALDVTMSVGVGIYPDDGEEMEDVLWRADTAMYQAKAMAGGNRVFPAPVLHAEPSTGGHIWGSLRHAVEEEALVLHFQPQVDLTTSRIVGVEALVRWREPNGALLHAEQFMPLAEQSGLVFPIGQWVLRTVCRQVVAWQAAGLPAMPIATNVSAAEFKHRHFADGVVDILQETGVDPAAIELEVNESVLMQDPRASLKTVHSLKSLGVRVAMDAFGSGYSSLNQLRQLPIDTIKMDEAFVHDVGKDVASEVILATMMDLGKGLGYRVVAQGVETEPQLEFLQRQGYEVVQGHYLGYPLAAEDAGLLLAIRRGCSQLPGLVRYGATPQSQDTTSAGTKR